MNFMTKSSKVFELFWRSCKELINFEKSLLLKRSIIAKTLSTIPMDKSNASNLVDKQP